MKKILLLGIIALSTQMSCYAQCIDAPECTTDNTHDVSGTLDHYDGSQCFVGVGTIPNSVNWNNWEYLSFSDTIHVKQIINFGLESQRVYVNGDIRMKKVNMHGGDTIIVKSGRLTLDDATSNNSFSGSYNVILLDDGAELYFGDTYMGTGSEIYTSGGSGNVIKVYPGCEGEPLPIYGDLEYKYSCEDQNVRLSWKAEAYDDFLLERRYENSDWFEVMKTNTGYCQQYIYQPTYYRMRVDGKYSNIVYVRPCDNSETDQEKPVSVNVYPNPVNNGEQVKLEIHNLKGAKEINVYNLLGQRVNPGVLRIWNADSSNEVYLRIQEFPAGLYILKLTGENFNYSTQIIVK